VSVHFGVAPSLLACLLMHCSDDFCIEFYDALGGVMYSLRRWTAGVKCVPSGHISCTTSLLSSRQRS
jgi:hypothetical protein